MIGWRRSGDQASDAARGNAGSQRQEEPARGGEDERAELSLADGMADAAGGPPLELVHVDALSAINVVDDADAPPPTAAPPTDAPFTTSTPFQTPTVAPTPFHTPAVAPTPFHTPGGFKPAPGGSNPTSNGMKSTPFHTPGTAAAAAAPVTPFFDAARTFAAPSKGADMTLPSGRGGRGSAGKGLTGGDPGSRFATPVTSGWASPADVDAGDADEDEEFHTPDGGASPVDIAKAYMRGDLRASAKRARDDDEADADWLRGSESVSARRIRPRASHQSNRLALVSFPPGPTSFPGPITRHSDSVLGVLAPPPLPPPALFSAGAGSFLPSARLRGQAARSHAFASRNSSGGQRLLPGELPGFSLGAKKGAWDKAFEGVGDGGELFPERDTFGLFGRKGSGREGSRPLEQDRRRQGLEQGQQGQRQGREGQQRAGQQQGQDVLSGMSLAPGKSLETAQKILAKLEDIRGAGAQGGMRAGGGTGTGSGAGMGSGSVWGVGTGAAGGASTGVGEGTGGSRTAGAEREQLTVREKQAEGKLAAAGAGAGAGAGLGAVSGAVSGAGAGISVAAGAGAGATTRTRGEEEKKPFATSSDEPTIVIQPRGSPGATSAGAGADVGAGFTGGFSFHGTGAAAAGSAFPSAGLATPKLFGSGSFSKSQASPPGAGSGEKKSAGTAEPKFSFGSKPGSAAGLDFSQVVGKTAAAGPDFSQEVPKFGFRSPALSFGATAAATAFQPPSSPPSPLTPVAFSFGSPAATATTTATTGTAATGAFTPGDKLQGLGKQGQVPKALFATSSPFSSSVAPSFGGGKGSTDAGTGAGTGFGTGTGTGTGTGSGSGMGVSGSEGTKAASAAPVFAFGASATPATAPANSGFAFGASATPATAPDNSGFAFGASATPATAPPKSGFAFGASATPATAPGKSGFAFGAAPAAPVFGSSSPAAAAAANAAAAAAAAGGAGGGTAAPSFAASPFAFGGRSSTGGAEAKGDAAEAAAGGGDKEDDEGSERIQSDRPKKRGGGGGGGFGSGGGGGGASDWKAAGSPFATADGEGGAFPNPFVKRPMVKKDEKTPKKSKSEAAGEEVEKTPKRKKSDATATEAATASGGERSTKKKKSDAAASDGATPKKLKKKEKEGGEKGGKGEKDAAAAAAAAAALKWRNVCAIAKPLADPPFNQKVLQLVKKAAKHKGYLRRGVKEVAKAVRKGEKGVCVLGGDVSPIDVISHLPIVCEEANIPYTYVPSRADLAAAVAAAVTLSRAPRLAVVVKASTGAMDGANRRLENADAAGDLLATDLALTLTPPVGAASRRGDAAASLRDATSRGAHEAVLSRSASNTRPAAAAEAANAHCAQLERFPTSSSRTRSPPPGGGGSVVATLGMSLDNTTADANRPVKAPPEALQQVRQQQQQQQHPEHLQEYQLQEILFRSRPFSPSLLAETAARFSPRQTNDASLIRGAATNRAPNNAVRASSTRPPLFFVAPSGARALFSASPDSPGGSNIPPAPPPTAPLTYDAAAVVVDSVAQFLRSLGAPAFSALPGASPATTAPFSAPPLPLARDSAPAVPSAPLAPQTSTPSASFADASAGSAGELALARLLGTPGLNAGAPESLALLARLWGAGGPAAAPLAQNMSAKSPGEGGNGDGELAIGAEGGHFALRVGSRETGKGMDNDDGEMAAAQTRGANFVGGGAEGKRANADAIAGTEFDRLRSVGGAHLGGEGGKGERGEQGGAGEKGAGGAEGGEEGEAESAEGGEDGEGNGNKRKMRLTQEQQSTMEAVFRKTPRLTPREKSALAGQLGVRVRQVEVWFQNRRARTKVKDTEVELDGLRRRCQTLADENHRLRERLAR
ncbi:unnamed protein product [Closterium sp. Yama58-4]|nr:unnamed protein product [Closterium sp. Yama58-4]